MKLFLALVVVVLAVSSVEGCEDKLQTCSTVLQPHYCYLEHNRKLCCQTCRRYSKNDPYCEYGDHYARISRRMSGHETTHSCESYVKEFGRHHCIAELKFRNTCCASCSENAS